MYLTINDVELHYEKQGIKGESIILLHGWGQNTTMMQPIADHLETSYQIYNIDLPGFGKSSEPPVVWGVEEYVELLHSFTKQLNIDNPLIIAHSFGARIALLYASKYPVSKMVITGGAGIRPKRGFGYYYRVYSYKIMKMILSLPGLSNYKKQMQEKAGSEDYKNTSGVMRASFVKIVNLDLTNILSTINTETLLVWGENDDATPLWMGQKMEALMPNAGLAVFENDGHYAYWHQMNRFLRVIDIFLESERN